MKIWQWLDNHFGTPQTFSDWVLFLAIYVLVPVATLHLLNVTF